MTETESKWAGRVEAWRGSGKTAAAFCEGKDFTAGALRYWASRLGRGVGAATAAGEQGRRGRVARRRRTAKTLAASKEVRLARVVRGPQGAEATETPILIEVGHARVGVRRGFDASALRVVLDILRGDR
jgi:hypothetical protein